MTSISAIEAIPYEIPYVKPLLMRAGNLYSARHVLVRITLEDGTVGIAEAPERTMFYGETTESIVAMVERVISPRLADGTGVRSVNGVRKVLGSIRANNTARAAVEMAYLDALARSVGQDMSEFLGGSRSPVEVSAMLGGGAPDEVGEEAAAAAESGISCFKVKIGYGYRVDLATVSAVRQAVGQAATIYVDGNLAYSYDEAARVLGAMRDDYGVAWAEEPAKIAPGANGPTPALPLPVMADETSIDAAEAGRAMAAGRAQKISIKVARTGYGESNRIVDLGSFFGCEPVLGSQGDATIGTCSGLAMIESRAEDFNRFAELSYYTRLRDDITVQRPVIRSGFIEIPDRTAGIGVSIDEDKLSHYTIGGL